MTTMRSPARPGLRSRPRILGPALAAAVGLSAAGATALVAQPARTAQAPAAQAPKPAAAAVPSEPGATTASYGDWVMRCQRSGGEKPARVCEAAQTIQVQGQAGPIAQIAVGRVAVGDPLLVTLVLPPNVGLPGSVRVLAEEKDAAGFELPWRRCLPGGCVAEAPVREDVLRRWRAAAEPGRIAYRNAAGQEIMIPLSFRGLAQALDALSREPM